MQTKQAYPGMTSHMTETAKNNYTKKTNKLVLFLAFYGVIYQNLLHRRFILQ